VEVYDQDSEEITQKFVDFLLKENVISGKSIENAENIYKGKQKQYLIKETLPKAWNKIVEGPDEDLVELIAETTEKLCGYKPEYATVERFITSNIQKVGYPPILKSSVTTPPTGDSPGRTGEAVESYRGKSISSFVFKKTRYDVKSWKDMLVQICNIMLATHRDRFEQVLSLGGYKRRYFARNPSELTPSSERINGTDIYVETHFSATDMVKHSRTILSLFGYAKDDLSIEVR
jgi:hypothetical protein